MEIYSTDSVRTQLHGMNSTIAKMKEDEDDRNKRISERIMNMEKKILDIDEKYENRCDEPRRAHGDQNKVRHQYKDSTVKHSNQRPHNL